MAAISAGEGISTDELQLALRNSGMPLEALRWSITPLGLHYLLIHYDIPTVDVGAWRLELAGCIAHPVALSLDELKQRETVTLPVRVRRQRPGASAAPSRLAAVADRGGRHGGVDGDAASPAAARSRGRREGRRGSVQRSRSRG